MKAFVTGDYLEALGLPQFYLRDSDKEGSDHEGKQIPVAVQDRVNAWEQQGQGVPIKVFLTRKREIENYVHLASIDRICGVEIGIEARLGAVDLDFVQISKRDQPLWQALQQAKVDTGFRLPEKQIRGVEIDYRKPKHVICGLFIPAMTLEEFRDRCATTDGAEQETSEIEQWFRAMGDLVGAANGR